MGRFAPSPSGPLHAGSLLAALGSWLDARAYGGRWLVRIEDVDSQRCRPAWAQTQLAQLAALGLQPDAPVLWQSQRTAAYAQALHLLQARGLAYPCACSRADLDAALAAQGQARQRHSAAIYPGTCRLGLAGRPARVWRLDTQACTHYLATSPVQIAKTATKIIATETPAGALQVVWSDRRLGVQQQDVARAVGDFVLAHADGDWAYQLAVVVDDAAQGVSCVVRGADLADNTARQIVLQSALGLPPLHYLHLPLVCDARGEKLSKHSGAPALDTHSPAALAAALDAAALQLGLPARAATQGVPAALGAWVAQWAALWV